MRHLVGIVIAAIMIFTATSALAVKEGILIWSNFSIESLGLDTSGPVKFSGTQSSDGITSLRINVFRREIVLNPSQISQLRGFSVNSIGLSYSRGYTKLGGRTLYITISKSSTSGSEVTKTIEFNEQGDLVVEKTKSSLPE